MTRTTANKPDIYTQITDKIIADLEQGVRTWMKPWNAEHAAGRITRPLRHNGQPYSGINLLNLWGEAVTSGYSAPIWMTFRQAKELGAHVRQGETGTLVVYANTFTRTEEDAETGEEIEKTIPFMKGYSVFNVEQIEGLPARYYELAAPALDPMARIDHAEAFFAAAGADIRRSGVNASLSCPLWGCGRTGGASEDRQPDAQARRRATDAAERRGREGLSARGAAEDRNRARTDPVQLHTTDKMLREHTSRMR